MLPFKGNKKVVANNEPLTKSAQKKKKKNENVENKHKWQVD